MASLGLPVRRLVRGLCAAIALLVLVAGLPWALTRYVGWPLPHHLPTPADVSGLLLAPLTTVLLIDLLAVACWIAWAAFTLDVARCAVTAARELRLPDHSDRRGPVHGLAALLVGAILLPLLTGRAAPAPPPDPATSLARPVAATAALIDLTHGENAPILAWRPATVPANAVVRSPDPCTGVHDSLWRIATRELGEGSRWPEIFALNRGAPLPYGGTFTWPSLVYPGQQLRLPTPTEPRRSPHHPGQAPNRIPSTSPTPAGSQPPPRTPTYTPAPAATPSPGASAPSAPASSTAAAPSPPTTAAIDPTGPAAAAGATTAPADRPSSSASSAASTAGPAHPAGVVAPTPPPPPGPGIAIGPETYVGLGLAAAVSAALLAARRRNRRSYRPGSGRRDDLAVAPAVYALRLAHLQHDPHPEPAESDNAAQPDNAVGSDDGPGPAGPYDGDGPDGPEGPNDDRDPPEGPGGGSTNIDVDLGQDLHLTDGLVTAGVTTSAGVFPAPPSAPADGADVPAVERPPQSNALVMGIRGGQEVVVDPGAVHGLGLVGAGAVAAVRAAVTTLLTVGPAAATTADAGDGGTVHTGEAVSVNAGRFGAAPEVHVVVPAADLVTLLGPASAGRLVLPPGLRVTDTLTDALDLVETQILARSAAAASVADQAPVVALVASVPAAETARLQAMVDNGAPYGVVGLLLGPWPAGATAHVRADGVVSATDPGPGQILRGARLFIMSAAAMADVLDVFGRAGPRLDRSVEPELGSRSSTDILSARPSSTPRRAEFLPGPGSPERGRTEPRHPPSATTPAVPYPSRPSPPIGPAAPVDLEVTAGTVPEINPEINPGIDPENGHEPDTVASALSAAEAASPVPAPSVPTRPGLRIVVLGPPRVYWVGAEDEDAPRREGDPATNRDGMDVTGAFQPRLREMLVFLAVHPRGATRESMIGALWPDSAPPQATNAVNTALSRLRGAVRAATGGAIEDVVLTGNGSFRLNADLVQVDFFAFARAQDARRMAADTLGRLPAYQAMIDVYAGPLAEGMSVEWIEPVREALRREALDAVAAVARALVATDPDRTLELLEVARAFDPYNELLYRDIMRLQARLGRQEAIGRTLALLTTRLAELDEQPTSETADLADRLERRGDTSSDTRSDHSGRRAS